jgi:hypothetical protein
MWALVLVAALAGDPPAEPPPFVLRCGVPTPAVAVVVAREEHRDPPAVREIGKPMLDRVVHALTEAPF